MSSLYDTNPDQQENNLTNTPTLTDKNNKEYEETKEKEPDLSLVNDTNHTEEEKEAIEPPSNEFEDNSNVPKLSYLNIFLLNLWFGFNAWGGPMAQIALIKDTLVIQQKWITVARFNRIFGVYQILPGPEATELCMFFGCLSGGRFGGFLGGLGFVLPGFLMILLFSYIYVIVGLDNVYFNASFRALQPIVSAMVLRATHKIAEHALISHTSHRFSYWLFGMAILAAIQTTVNFNYFITLGVCGIAFMFIERKLYWVGLFVILLELVGYGIYIGINRAIPSPSSLGIGVAKAEPGSGPDPGHIFALGLVAGSLSFGGAYVTIPFLQAEAVTIGQWMAISTFLDSIAIGNIIPSPLVMFSTFIGFQAGYLWGGHNIGFGFLGGLLIAVGMLFPCFLFTILGHNLLEKLVRNKFLAAFFDGISGTVVGIIAVTAMNLLNSSITSTTGLANVSQQDLPILLAKNSSIAAVLYVLTLAALYGFKKPYLSLWLVIFDITKEKSKFDPTYNNDGFDDEGSDGKIDEIDDKPEQTVQDTVLKWCVIYTDGRKSMTSEVDNSQTLPWNSFGEYLHESMGEDDDLRWPPRLTLEEAIKQHNLDDGNLLEAWKNFIKYAKRGDHIALYWIGFYLQYDILTASNLFKRRFYEEAIDEFAEEAETYLQAAMMLYKKSADFGYPEAQLRYGFGLYYFRLSAENNNYTVVQCLILESY
ncbi:13285_t:CDS:2 [Dentiscutata erythropus]|uniref:13285_t:CDS:1 n=1 Tax=Dentiscutata erythropus TaxID=1348616 RepID=A0A9N9A103_9GLOM|nr:13285_t:CDS:2 [Dentiscutata erythropus]